MVKRLSNTDQNNNRLTNIPTPINGGDAVNKAFIDALDFIESDTTDRITVSNTAPASPSTGDLWFDNTSLPENLAPSSIVWKETPTGAVNGINFAFATSQPYVSGTLQGFINGIAQSGFISETGAGSGVFEFDVAPLTGDDVKVQYQTRSVSTGNASSLGNVSLNGLLEALYPVGAVYVSGSDTMPAIISGIGTWARLKGRIIVGVDDAQTEFNTVNATGGSKTHRHKGYADGDGLGNGDLRATIGARSGGANTINYQAVDPINPNTGGGLGNGTYSVVGTNEGSQGFSHYTKVVGFTSTSYSLQPYKTKFMWERTA